MPASLVLSRRIVSTPPSNGPLRVALFAVLLACVCCNVARAADMHKVLRIASSDITSLDPQQGTDLYSTRIAAAIFEGLYEFEYLSAGSKVIPDTAESYWPSPFGFSWKYLDLDVAMRDKMLRESRK